MFFYWGSCASNRMHRKKLHRVLNAPLGFFLAKPVGELLSTFSSDQDKADESLPDVLHLAGTNLLNRDLCFPAPSSAALEFAYGHLPLVPRAAGLTGV
jgi:hypothetical protein